MVMISGGDESARNAFRAYLRDDSSQLSIISTEEMPPGDVLEVRNLGDAIERAERALRESSRPRDMFAELGGPTDDASGPAVYARPTPTPIPPPLSTQPLPVLLVPNDVPTEEDAFMQPSGRMRSFADETLDGYRADSTMEVRLGARRKSLTLVVGALLGLLALAVVFGVVAVCMPKAQMKSEPKPAVVDAPKVVAPTTEPQKPAVPTLNVNDLPSAR
jgi:hypothetical protein